MLDDPVEHGPVVRSVHFVLALALGLVVALLSVMALAVVAHVAWWAIKAGWSWPHVPGDPVCVRDPMNTDYWIPPQGASSCRQP